MSKRRFNPIAHETIERYLNQRYPWLCELINDPEVSDIWINGPDQLYVERDGQVEPFVTGGLSEESLTDLAYAIAASSNRPVSVREPVLETAWTNKTRVQAILPPLSRHSAVFAIRKPRFQAVSLDQLIDSGMCSAEQAEWLRLAVRNKRTLFISGATGSGKTTLLQALLNEVPSGERLLILEDTQELSIPEHVQGVCLQSRPSYGEENAIELADLVKVALRMRPDRIMIGEVRGREAFGMIQSLNTGHAGGMTSIHANSNLDALLRMETLLMLTEGLTPTFSRRLLSRAADVLIHVRRNRDGIRRVEEIHVVNGRAESSYDLKTWES